MISGLGRQSFYKKINIRNFIHHRLASGKFALYFNTNALIVDNQTDHNHCITFPKTTMIQFRRQCKTKTLLVKCNTSPKLRDTLLQGI